MPNEVDGAGRCPQQCPCQLLGTARAVGGAAVVVTDSETNARLNGVASQMRSFDFFFVCTLGEVMLRHTVNLSKSLRTDISVVDGQNTHSEQLQHCSHFAVTRNLMPSGNEF